MNELLYLKDIYNFVKSMSNIYTFRSFETKDFELAKRDLVINTPNYFDENEAQSFMIDLFASVNNIYCLEVDNNLCLIGGFKTELKKNKEVAYIELLYEFFEYKLLRDYYEVSFIKYIIKEIKTQRILTKCTIENYQRFANNGFKIVRYKKDYQWNETYKTDLYLMELK